MVTVKVSSPRTENEGRRDQYTSYLVATEKHSVRRRYSDFQWLYRRLQTELPGAIVPIVPRMFVMSKGKKFDPDYVEQRRRHLQNFMDTVVEHFELARAPSMTPFMIDRFGEEFDTGKKNVEQANPTLAVEEDENTPSGAGAAARKVSNMFAKAGTLMRVKAGSQEMMTTPQEKEVEHVANYIGQIEGQVKQLVKAAENLTKLTRDMANTMADMNGPIGEWKLIYTSNSNRGDDIIDMMTAMLEFTNDYSQLIGHKHREEQVEFEDRMVHLGNDVKAFRLALKQRRHWQLAYTARCKQITAKEEAISKATQNLKPPEVTNKLSSERAELQKEAKAEKDKLYECTERFLQEAERTSPRMEVALKDAFRSYAKIQVAYTNRINDAWGQLLPFIGDKPEPPADAPPPLPTDDEPAVMGEGEADLTDTQEDEGDQKEKAVESV